MFMHIEANKERSIQNREGIVQNEKNIRDNKQAIDDLKRNTVPYLVFESSQARLDKIIHRLIIALILALAILFISNAVWIYAWNHSSDDTTIINKDGVSNFIGRDGKIGD